MGSLSPRVSLTASRPASDQGERFHVWCRIPRRLPAIWLRSQGRGDLGHWQRVHSVIRRQHPGRFHKSGIQSPDLNGRVEPAAGCHQVGTPDPAAVARATAQAATSVTILVSATLVRRFCLSPLADAGGPRSGDGARPLDAGRSFARRARRQQAVYAVEQRRRPLDGSLVYPGAELVMA